MEFMINQDKLIGAFIGFLKEVDEGVEHGVTVGGDKLLVKPVWEKIKEYLGTEEYKKETLLAELYGKYCFDKENYFSWLDKGGMDKKNRLIFLLIHYNELANAAAEANLNEYFHLKNLLFAFFNLILFNTNLWTTPKKRGRPKKKSVKSS